MNKVYITQTATLRKIGESVAGDPIYTSDSGGAETAATTVTDSEKPKPACVSCSRLASRVEELEKEVDHWKANHAECVRRKRVKEAMMAKHSRTTRIVDSASGNIGLDASSEIRKALQKRGKMLVYLFEIRIKAEDGDQIEIAEEMDVLDAISATLYGLPEYENAACITTKIMGDPIWQKATRK